ncbi:nucleolar preribosomal GTPase, putative [Plasmodium gallinaceum]|uniref:Nucleolar preribosomal GTPase, putative n=1 Tax=Plasmodium gallinaceum TaxID=5849 RepID=A0A1J1GP48_PLAGA|nr:nucleolar preribosomal GTPase, putative [Plasmodium gallinaceum]CRG93055.1 nucleolar preribosomal GTPase, putative [Plasmodium gallinaceum]
MVKLKKTSRRQTLKQKYAIIKKVAAHKKKLKKIIKKTNIHNRRSTKNSLKIPECIFKKSILKNIKTIAESKKNKNLVKCTEIKIDDFNESTIKNVKYLLENSLKDDSDDGISNEYLENMNFKDYVHLNFNIKMKLFEKVKNENYSKLNDKYLFIDNLIEVIRNSDALFYIVDVRNPLIYLDKDIIDFIKLCKKEIIIVLNKCDLVDSGVIQQWLTYFRNYFITLPFICFIKKIPNYLNKNKLPEKLYDHFINKSYVKYIKALFKDTKITYGVIGHIYTGRNSFIHTLLNEMNCNNKIKGTDIKIDENINIYGKIGLILKKDLKGMELIKKLHSLDKKEVISLLNEFLLCLNGKNLIKVLSILKENHIINENQLHFSSNDNKLEKKEKKNRIIHSFLYENGENNNINSKNMQKLYNKLFLNKILYYIIPKSKITCFSENSDFLYHFGNLNDDVYHKIDEFIFSQKKKYGNYIIIKSDKFNFYT